MRQFLTELRRRHVFRFGVMYLAVAWLLTQVVTSIEEPLGLPQWIDTVVIVLLVIGFPVVLIAAWAFESRPRDDEDSGAMDRARLAAAAAGGSAAGDTDAERGGLPRRGEIRFCTTPSGYRLAYTRVGSGYPVVKTGNWISHQELEWDNLISGPFVQDLSREFDLISYDGRGTGLSDREVSEFSLDTMVEDMETVADANALEQFAIFAFSQSAAVSIAYAVRHPERVTHMVFYGGFAHNFRSQAEIDAMATLFEQNWGQLNAATRQIFTTALFPGATTEEFEAFNELQRHGISPENAARLFRACHAIDVREDAKRVEAPTLVVHARDERGVPVECSRVMASLIPNSRFLTLDSKNHMALKREPAYRQFLDETVAFLKHG
jgi:pimeloyl-ACP methyl ester carboxylesterase